MEKQEKQHECPGTCPRCESTGGYITVENAPGWELAHFQCDGDCGVIHVGNESQHSRDLFNRATQQMYDERTPGNSLLVGQFHGNIRDEAGRYEIFLDFHISANDAGELGFAYVIDSFWSDGVYQVVTNEDENYRIFIVRDA